MVYSPGISQSEFIPGSTPGPCRGSPCVDSLTRGGFPMSMILRILPRTRAIGRIVSVLSVCGGIALADDLAPKADERQLPVRHALGDERAAHDHGRAGRRRPDRGRQPGAPGGRRLRRGPGRGRRRDRRGRVPDARLAPPALRRHRPRPQGQDDPAQGRRGGLPAGPGRRLRRAAGHGRGPRGLRASAPASRSGTTTPGASTPPWRGSRGAAATPSRSTRR